jgi:hypothetical protein
VLHRVCVSGGQCDMGVRGPRKTPLLRIELIDAPPSYVPGQRLHGEILVVASEDASIETLEVSFVGQATTQVSSANGQLESRFDNSDRFVKLTRKLKDKHYIQKTGEVSYLFDLEVPRSVESGSRTRHPTEIDSSRQLGPLSTDLSSSAVFTESTVGKGWHALVEYAVEARASRSIGADIIVTQPVRIQSGGLIPTLDMNDPTDRVGSCRKVTWRSWKLLPESQSSQTTMRQRTASPFRSPSVPKFTFELDVSHPKTLQLGNSQTIPLVVGIRPITDSEETSIVPSAVTFYRFPSIVIDSVTVVLHSRTTIKYPTPLKAASETKESQIPLLSRAHLEERLVVRSMASDQKTLAEEETISSTDIGQLCQMRLPDPRESKARVNTGKRSKPGYDIAVQPSLSLPAIWHRHVLSWTINLRVLGCNEQQTIRSKVPHAITVIDGPFPTLQEPLPPPSYTPPAYAISPNESASQRTVFELPAGRPSTSDSTSHDQSDDCPDDVQNVLRTAKAAVEAAFMELPAYEAASGVSQISTAQKPNRRGRKAK